MNILLYANEHSERGVELKDDIEQVESLQSLTRCWNFDQLREYFSIPNSLPGAAVFLAENYMELQSFKEFICCFDQVFLILILPDTQKETVAFGHQLHPRFIAYHDSDFTDVCAVIEQHGIHCQKKQQGDPPETKPSYHSDWVK